MSNAEDELNRSFCLNENDSEDFTDVDGDKTKQEKEVYK
jgi:hypothetical protein